MEGNRHPMDRRTFLKGGGVALVPSGLVPRAFVEPALAAPATISITHGVVTGDVTATSALIWSPARAGRPTCTGPRPSSTRSTANGNSSAAPSGLTPHRREAAVAHVRPEERFLGLNARSYGSVTVDPLARTMIVDLKTEDGALRHRTGMPAA